MAHLTPQETRIMDMWEGGMSMQRIAHRLNLKRRTVSNTVNMYDAGNLARTERAALTAGSARLFAAIKAARPELQA